MNRRNFIRMLSQSFVGAAFLPSVIDAAEPDDNRRSQFVFAQVKYRGGDWNPHPLSVTPLMEELMARTSVEAASAKREVTLADPDLFNYPFLYLAGRYEFEPFSQQEIETLRRFLSYGGFLLIDDALGQQGYGFDKSVRREMQRIFPGNDFKRLPSGHAALRSYYLLRRHRRRAHYQSQSGRDQRRHVHAGDLLSERPGRGLGARSSRQVDQHLYSRRRSAAQRRFSSRHQYHSLRHDRELQGRSDPRPVHSQAAHPVKS